MLAHEIGHEKRNHVKKGLAISAAVLPRRVLDPQPPPALAAALPGVRVRAARVPRPARAPGLLLGPLHLLPAAAVLHAVAEARVRGGPIRRPGGRIRGGSEIRAPAAEQGQPVQPLAASPVQFLPLFASDPRGADRGAGPGEKAFAGMKTRRCRPPPRLPAPKTSRGISTTSSPPPADRGIDAILAEADRRVDAFAARYRGRVAALSAAEMREPARRVRGDHRVGRTRGELRLPFLVHAERRPCPGRAAAEGDGAPVRGSRRRRCSWTSNGRNAPDEARADAHRRSRCCPAGGTG